MTPAPSSGKSPLSEPPVAPRTIAVTGATGFIGKTLVRQLLASGFCVKALVRPQARHRQFPAPGLEWCEGDLADPASLKRLLTGADAVAHCAGVVRGRTLDDFVPVNVQGVTNLVRAARALAGPPRLVALSSLAAREPTLSHYAASKKKGEDVLAEQAGDLEWVALRPPAVYGPGDREMLPLFKAMERGLAVIPGNPEGRFSLLFVDDLAKAVIQALTTPGAGMQRAFELHDGHPGGYGWGEITAIATRVLGRTQHRLVVPGPLLHLLGRINAAGARLLRYHPMLTPGKARELCHSDWVCDNAAFVQATGWQPAVDFEEGLAKTLRR